MTDPKALEHACLSAGRSVHHFDRMGDDLPLRASIAAHARAIERLEAAEARHAAELREQAERFSDVAAKVSRRLKQSPDANVNWMADLLAPFILPAPDPLVELAREMTLLDGVVRTDNQKAAIREGRAGNTASDDFYDRLRTALASRQYEVRKIGEAK